MADLRWSHASTLASQRRELFTAKGSNSPLTPYCAWADLESSNARGGGDEDTSNASGDEDLDKVLEGIESGN